MATSSAHIPRHEDSCRVIVNYARTLNQMIDAGRYDWKDSRITEKRFPINRHDRVDVEIVLIHPNRWVSAEEVLRIIKSDPRGLRPINIRELLALGATFPDLQREFPIVALGSEWQTICGDRYSPLLEGNRLWRGLHLFWIAADWNEYYRFAAVRK